MALRVAAAPVSYGVFEITVGRPGLPDGPALVEAMADAGYAGSELGPPGYLGRGREVGELLAAHDMRARRLVPAAALQPRRRLRRGHARARGDARAARPRPPKAASSPSCCSPTGSASPIACATRAPSSAHPETWLGERRRRLLFDNASPRGRAVPRARIRHLVPPARRHLHRDARARSTRCSSRWTRACSASASTRATRRSAAATRSRSCARPASSSTTSTSRTSTSNCWPVCTPRARGSRKPGRRACSASSAPGGAQVDECLAAPARDRLRPLDRCRAGSHPRPRRALRRRAGVGRAQPRMAPRARPVSARETAAHLGRLRGLDTLTDSRGIFALAAMDHRDSLRRRIREGRPPRAATRANRRAQGDRRPRARAARHGPADRRGARCPGDRARRARRRAPSSCRWRRRATRTSQPGG